MTQRAWQEDSKDLLRARILSAAVDELCERGWRALTVAAVAQRAGVRRQAVYEEIGTKAELGRALVEREAQTYLAEVSRRITRAPTPSLGLVSAAEFTLRDAAQNRLVVAVLGVAGGTSEPELVSVATAGRGPVLAPALSTVTTTFRAAFPEVPAERARTVCGVVVRLTLSHLLQPIGTIEEATAEVRAVVEHLLP